MKYVVVKRGQLAQPIIFPEQMNHSDMVPKGWTPVSAGFAVYSTGFIHVDETRIAESLKLGPKPKEDYRILNILVSNRTDSSFFLDFYNEVH